MKTINQPKIIDIQPKVLPKDIKKIWLSIIGKNFTPELSLVLIVGGDRYPIPRSRVRYLDSRLIQVGVFLSDRERRFDIEIKGNSSGKELVSYSAKTKPTQPLARMIRY